MAERHPDVVITGSGGAVTGTNAVGAPMKGFDESLGPCYTDDEGQTD